MIARVLSGTALKKGEGARGTEKQALPRMSQGRKRGRGNTLLRGQADVRHWGPVLLQGKRPAGVPWTSRRGRDTTACRPCEDPATGETWLLSPLPSAGPLSVRAAPSLTLPRPGRRLSATFTEGTASLSEKHPGDHFTHRGHFRSRREQLVHHPPENTHGKIEESHVP